MMCKVHCALQGKRLRANTWYWRDILHYEQCLTLAAELACLVRSSSIHLIGCMGLNNCTTVWMFMWEDWGSVILFDSGLHKWVRFTMLWVIRKLLHVPPLYVLLNGKEAEQFIKQISAGAYSTNGMYTLVFAVHRQPPCLLWISLRSPQPIEFFAYCTHHTTAEAMLARELVSLPNWSLHSLQGSVLFWWLTIMYFQALRQPWEAMSTLTGLTVRAILCLGANCLTQLSGRHVRWAATGWKWWHCGRSCVSATWLMEELLHIIYCCLWVRMWTGTASQPFSSALVIIVYASLDCMCCIYTTIRQSFIH